MHFSLLHPRRRSPGHPLSDVNPSTEAEYDGLVGSSSMGYREMVQNREAPI